MLTNLLILGLIVFAPLTVMLTSAFLSDIVNYARQKVKRQKGVIIDLQYAPPEPDDLPTHFALVKHRFQEMQLETKVTLSQRRWEKLSIGKSFRFMIGADYPYTVFTNYWLNMAKSLLLRLLLIVASAGASLGLLLLLDQRLPGSLEELF